MAADSLPKLAALEWNQEALLGFISQHAEIINELYEHELITEEAMDSFEPPMVLHAVCEMVKEDPQLWSQGKIRLFTTAEIGTKMW